MAEGQCGRCIRVSLIVINVIFGIVGVILLVAAILCRATPTTILGVFGTVPKAIAGFQNYVIISLVIIGLLIALISLLGLIGASGRIRCLLCLYSILLCCLVIVQIVMETYFFSYPNAFQSSIHDSITGILATYNDVNSPDVVMDSFFQRLQCCGFNNPTDDFRFRGGEKIPYSCCVDYPKHLDNPSPSLDACVNTLSNSFTEGCYELLVEKIKDNSGVYITIIAFIFFLEITCSVLSFVFCAQIHRLSKISPSEMSEPHKQNGCEKSNNKKSLYEAKKDNSSPEKKRKRKKKKRKKKKDVKSSDVSESDWSVSDEEGGAKAVTRDGVTF